MILEALLTEATCSEACWTAREDSCRCSCGGKNHGCLRTADGVRPIRNCKMDGERYELKAVSGPGVNLDAEAKAINRSTGIKSHVSGLLLADYYGASTSRDPMFRRLPAKIRTATQAQIERWPELAAERERIKDLLILQWASRTVYLLWVKVPTKENAG